MDPTRKVAMLELAGTETTDDIRDEAVVDEVMTEVTSTGMVTTFPRLQANDWYGVWEALRARAGSASSGLSPTRDSPGAMVARRVSSDPRETEVRWVRGDIRSAITPLPADLVGVDEVKGPAGAMT